MNSSQSVDPIASATQPLQNKVKEFAAELPGVNLADTLATVIDGAMAGRGLSSSTP
jgi:hypothetical protein